MKKLLLFLLLFIPAMSYAQLSVESNGNVIAGSKLFNNSTWGIGLQSGITTNSNSNAKVGIYGRVDSYTNSNFIYGVMGIACNTSGNCGFGVTGCLADNSMNGAGIFGSTSHEGYMGITGRYAGFFNGSTKVNGTLTATSVVQQSDVRRIPVVHQRDAFSLHPDADGHRRQLRQPGLRLGHPRTVPG